MFTTNCQMNMLYDIAKRRGGGGKMAATSMRAHSHTPLQTINRGNYFMRPLRSSAPGKHKSAVELLQESKCLYVKSEIVLDQRQQLKSSSPDNLHSPFVKVPGSSAPTSAQLRRSYNASASSTDQLQAKLRKLLNADSKENLIEDTNVKEEVRRSPQPYRRSNSHKQTQPRGETCSVHHKSLPDLHVATSSGSDSSEPASCQYTLYTNNRKCSSSRQSTNDEISIESSTSRSKHLSSQRSSKSSHSSGRQGLALASPVKSSISYGGSASKMEYRRPEPLWDSDADDGPRLRPILRSKSDVGHRHTRLAPAPPSPPTPANLDTFFELLGLDSASFHILTKPSSQSSSPVFFSDTSSVDSLYAANQSCGGSEGATGSSGELPSIVERNARIIKWLCNCRKAQLSLPATATGVS